MDLKRKQAEYIDRVDQAQYTSQWLVPANTQIKLRVP
jgi:hypothetical protein